MHTIDRTFEQRPVNLDVADPLAALLAARGCANSADAEPGLSKLLNWRGFAGIHGAVERAARAIARNQLIAVVGDYDADGATASAVMMAGLRAFGARAVSVVPSRHAQGYGLSPSVVTYVASTAAQLIVTVDNGVAAFEGVAAAAAHNIPVIVTDHHLAGDRLPESAAMVNPNSGRCDFASKSVAGCGVAFYFICALRNLLVDQGISAAQDYDVRALLPYVAVGTVADMVALDFNNRALVGYGLRRIREKRCPAGLLALAGVAGIDAEFMSTTDISFKLAPRINAAGRVADMSIGIDCLLSEDRIDAEHAATRLNTINEERKKIQADGIDVALSVADKNRLPHSVVVDGEFHEGVVGILAGRIKESYALPTVVMTDTAACETKGSARSVPGVHIRDVLEAVSREQPGLILKFGGHAAAAGLTLRSGGVDAFRDAFERQCDAAYRASGLTPGLVTQHDGPLPARFMTTEFAHSLEATMWGQAMAAPSFVDTFDIQSIRPVGVGHAQLALKKDNTVIRAIWFNAPVEALQSLSEITLHYELQINRWAGTQTVQALIRDRVCRSNALN
jgi:single-stranded-DNA-specific exonuclease